MAALWSPSEAAMIDHAFREAVVGSPETVRAGIADFVGRTQVDELMITSAIYDQTARLRSIELVAQLRAS